MQGDRRQIWRRESDGWSGGGGAEARFERCKEIGDKSGEKEATDGMAEEALKPDFDNNQFTRRWRWRAK
ncbi:hypothetical protein U1Q18_034355, partial [Sarracenia purpurea var. burkii]